MEIAHGKIFCFPTITQTLLRRPRHNKLIVLRSQEKLLFFLFMFFGWLFYLVSTNVTRCQKREKAPTLIILSTQHDVRVKFNKLNSVMTGKQNLRNNWMHVLRGLSHVLGLTDRAFALEETPRYDRLNSRRFEPGPDLSLPLFYILHLFVWLCVFSSFVSV